MLVAENGYRIGRGHGGGSGESRVERKVELPEGNAGLLPERQICPTVEFPLGDPFTAQVTLVSEVFATTALRGSRWPGDRFAEDGETATVTLLTSVTTAKSVGAPGELAVAWMVTTLQKADRREPCTAPCWMRNQSRQA